MPATMAVTQQDIDTQIAEIAEINQAIRDGVRQVTLRGQTTTYNTTDSLIRARNDARAELASMQGQLAGASPRIQYLYHAGRGYD